MTWTLSWWLTRNVVGVLVIKEGEILGLSLSDIDEDRITVHVQRQIRVVDRTLVFALPKGGKKRRVPLSSGVLAATRTHGRAFPSTEVTLPWSEPGGKPVTIGLLVTGNEGRLYTGDSFHKVVWQGAFRATGLEYRKRADGMHALRHFYASTLLAQGVSIKELAEYLATPTRLHAPDVHAPCPVQLRAGPASDRRRVRPDIG